MTKCDKGWVGCFWSVMSHFLKQRDDNDLLCYDNNTLSSIMDALFRSRLSNLKGL